MHKKNTIARHLYASLWMCRAKALPKTKPQQGVTFQRMVKGQSSPACGSLSLIHSTAWVKLGWLGRSKKAQGKGCLSFYKKPQINFHGYGSPCLRKYSLKTEWRRDKLYKFLLCLALKIVFNKFLENIWRNLIIRKNKNSEVFCADRQLKLRWEESYSWRCQNW